MTAAHDPTSAQTHHVQAMDAEAEMDPAGAIEDEDALAASAGGPYPGGVADEHDNEHHPSKRQRLESDVMDHEPALDDEAVLALAAHNGTTPGDYAEYVLPMCKTWICAC